MKVRTWLRVFGGLLFLIAPPLYAAAADPAADAVVGKEFRARADQYAKLHRTVESKLPAMPTKATSEQIAAHQRALAEAIRAARSSANRGDVFGTAEDYFRRAVAAELKGKDNLTARQTIKEENPANKAENSTIGEPNRPVILAVNAPYPPKAPLTTVPPTMLIRLPPLPDELNYRFVGRHLILHDTHADLIIDFIVNATP